MGNSDSCVNIGQLLFRSFSIFQQKFMDKYEKEIKKFGMLHEYHDSKEYLLQNMQLVTEDTANYLTLWCVNLEVEKVRYASV